VFSTNFETSAGFLCEDELKQGSLAIFFLNLVALAHFYDYFKMVSQSRILSLRLYWCQTFSYVH